MKPDDSMPFFGTDLFNACEGHSDAVTLGYIRCLWHYWNHTHCAGLTDDDDFLRRLCRCEPQNWARTKGIIFDGQFFFFKNGTHWHQKHAKELHQQTLELYQKRVNLAQNARESKSISNAINAIKPDTKLTNAQVVLFSKEYERILEKMKIIKDTYGGHQTWADDDSFKFESLKERRDELKALLGVKA